MKPEHIIAILRSMNADDLARWFNHWLEHSDKYRNRIIERSDSSDTLGMACQIIRDWKKTPDHLEAIRDYILGQPGHYIFYDYDNNESIHSFFNSAEMLRYFDIENFIPMFEDETAFTYEVIFGWMTAKTIDERIKEDCQDYVDRFIEVMDTKGLKHISREGLKEMLPELFKNIAKGTLENYASEYCNED